MSDYIKPEWFVILVMLIPCIIAGFLARNRGRSIIGWGVLCALFPVFLLVIYFKKPLRDVPGGFRRCSACGEYVDWRSPACKYCGSVPPPAG